MALRILQNDLDKIFDYLFTGEGEGNKALRNIIKQPSHTFTVDAQKTLEDILEHGEADKPKQKLADMPKVFKGQNPKRDKEVREILGRFCKDLVNHYITEIHKDKDYIRGAVDVIGFIRGWSITIRVYHKTDPMARNAGVNKIPYNWVSDKRTLYGNTVINGSDEYKEIFGLAKTFSQGMGGGRGTAGKFDESDLTKGGFSQIGQIGHAPGHSVAAAAGGAWVASVDEFDLAIIDGKSQGKRLQTAFSKMEKEIADLGINLEHFRHLIINPTKPEIKDSLTVLTNLEGAFVNAAKGSTDEKVLKATIKKIAQAFQDECEAYYKELIKNKRYHKRAESEPFITQFKNLIIFSTPGIRRLLKKRVAKKVGGKITLPKKIAKRKTKPKTKQVPLTRDKNAGRISGVGDIPKGKTRPSSMEDTRFNAATLPGLINAKLGATVLDNMGNPALENRTGAFAGSARVMAAFQSPGGLQLNYTYDKNPYEVFEMGGRGREPWATTGRDPRTIIDKSIRELAAEMALGALTTRRV